jgi:hypothetical protein
MYGTQTGFRGTDSIGIGMFQPMSVRFSDEFVFFA